MLPETANQENALEARGINPQTELPDNVTLSGDATSVRFHTSRKAGGYVKKEVDEYIINVIAPSLDWFKIALERRDQEVYRLGKEIEGLELDIVGLNRDIESANMSNMILSSKKANEDDKEMATLMEQNVELRRRIDEMSAASTPDLAEYDNLIETYRNNEVAYQQQIDQMTQYISELKAQLGSESPGTADDSSKELQDALEKCALMEKDLEEFQTYVDKIQVYTNSLEERISTLEAELAAASNSNPEIEQLNLRASEAEDKAASHAEHAEQLMNQIQQYTEELEAKNNEIAGYIESIEQLNSQIAAGAAASDYEEAYNQLSEQYTEAVELYNTTVAEYEQRIGGLEAEINEAVERANEYYEHYVALQGQIDSMSVANDSEDSLIKDRNVELSAQLDQVQTELTEVQGNYAALYEAYEELTSSIPESGIVSMEEYAAIKVEYDQATAELTKIKKENNILQKEVDAHSAGMIGEGITVENFNSMREALETANYENKELQMKYEALLARKDSQSQPASSSSEEITYTEEEYMVVYTHATEAIEQYNELVSVHEELRQAYEELVNAVQSGQSATQPADSPAKPEAPSGLPVSPQIKPEAPSGLPVSPQIKPAIAETTQGESKYKEKKLPAGITLEDLE